MKTISSLLLLAVLSPAALLTSSCAKASGPAQDTAASAAGSVQATASDSWNSIKDYTYEKRADFASGLDRMAAANDTDVRAMNAKMKGLPDDAAKARDSANREFADASAQLKTSLADLRASTADTWAAAKDKAAQGWQRVNAAYEALKATPTA
jgi:UDP-N-acetylglucosamine enolpyruvyl transferase